MATSRTRPLTPTEVADVFGVSVGTIRQWDKDGTLRSFRTAGNHRRFHPEDVDALLASLSVLPDQAAS